MNRQKMAHEDSLSNFEQAFETVSEPERNLEALFIEEDEDDYFEDCMEEIEAALAPSGDSMKFSQKCREALQAEFNDLMRQMLTQLDDFDATHETKSTPPDFFRESQEMLIRNGLKQISDCEELIPETAVPMAVDEAVECAIEAGPELSANSKIKELGTTFESCIEEVNQLQRRREELVQELLELEKPMAQEVQALRDELGEAQNSLIKAHIERQGLHEEIRLVKRRLFIAARDCAQSQVNLATQQKEVEQLNRAKEEMNSHIVMLNEEIAQLHCEHQDQLQALYSQMDNFTQESSKSKTRSYLSQGRRASSDLQQYLQEGIKALEEWYEPRLLALLKRRETSAEALSKSREQCQELKAQLGPLKDEEQKLALQRSRLEERIRLMERQRKEDVEQYRETIDLLEENSRELKTELQIQINKIKEMEGLKNNLAEQLYSYKESTEKRQPQDISLEEKT